MHPQVRNQSFKKKQESPSFSVSHVLGITFLSLYTWLERSHSLHFWRSNPCCKREQSTQPLRSESLCWSVHLMLEDGNTEAEGIQKERPSKTVHNHHKIKHTWGPLICILSKENENREQQGQAQEKSYLMLWFSNFISNAEAPLSVTALWEKVPLCTAFSSRG